jgi:iron complex outermembrane receptor protein
MKPLRQSSVLLLLYGLSAVAGAQSAAVSEKDYLDDVPVVLSVSRLPQRLDETPGAVSIIDRQMIRMSGARDVADLLRLVPGFRVTNSFESNTPQGSYHSTLSDYSNHIQVMVDGRSVYSTYLQGSTGPGLQTVALEDIERIEVYRGSNSAAYGARAFLGSINIVTRDLVDTQGALAQVSRGGNGIEDQMLRLGWGDERARFRLSADGRNDDGLDGTSGASRVQRVNLRADLRAGPHDVVELRTGQSLIDAGVGFAGDADNNARTRRIDTSFVQLDWRRSLDADQDLALQASHTVERIRDAFIYTPAPSLTVDFGGQSSNSNLLLQHTVRLNPVLRLVWGAELRRESIVSRPLYNTDARFNNDFTRLFTNVEWRLHPDLLLNAGALMEDSSQAGHNNAPRVMLNWRVAEGHTLRGGVSRAFRPPSNFEKYANVRYFIGGVLADSTDVARGGMLSEKVLVRELGYLAELPANRLSFDLRLFDEHVTGLVGREPYSLPGSGGNNQAFDFVNDEDFSVHGHEFQLRWKPWTSGQLVYAYASVDSTQFYNATIQVGRYGTQGLMFMQQLPAGLEFGLIYSEADAGRYPGWDASMPAVRRTDLRLAKALRVAGRPAELALVGQNLGSSYPDFRPELAYPQRVYVQLKVEH